MRPFARAVDAVLGKTAVKLSQVIHDWSRSWQDGTNEDVEIYSDLLNSLEREEIARHLAAFSDPDE